MTKKIIICIFTALAFAACSDSLPTSNEYLTRGEAYHKDGKPQKALEMYNKALKINPNNIDVYASRGAAYFFLKDYQKAADDFVKVIETKPGDPAAYSALGAVFAATGNNDEALKYLNYAIALSPAKPEQYLSRGSVYFGMGNYQSAVDDYSVVIRLTPFAGAYEARALAYEKMGDKDLADADHAKAKDPDTPKYLNQLIY